MEKELLAKIIEDIETVRKAFGAPGDYGYNTEQGKALFSLYKLLAELRHLTN